MFGGRISLAVKGRQSGVAMMMMMMMMVVVVAVVVVVVVVMLVRTITQTTTQTADHWKIAARRASEAGDSLFESH